MGWLEDKIIKWQAAIDARGGAGKGDNVVAGWQSVGDDPEALAEWSAQAMVRLAQQVPDSSARQKIMLDRSCVFTEEFGDEAILALRRLYHETGQVEEVLRSMRENKERFGQPFLEGDAIIEVRRPRDPAAYAKAKNDYERQLAACFCPLIRASRKRVPLEYCCCSAGWFRGIYQGIFRRPVTVTVEKSLLNGDDSCRFSIAVAAG
jgi:hypothetical protein